MELKAKLLDIHAGGRNIAILDDETAGLLGILSSDRVSVAYKNQRVIAMVNIDTNFPRNSIGLYVEISKVLEVKNGQAVEVKPAEKPESLAYVHAKIRGERLRDEDMKAIVKDVVERHLSDVELASFVAALHIRGSSMNEILALSKAMVQTGKTLKLDKSPILDKHSVGGMPGDKTSILLVPIIAAAGFVIPKTSSRAVTSPAGTADRVENLCPVNLTIEEMSEVVDKTNGCLVWGGALELAPADDLFIQIEYQLGIDPLLLPSIISKKKAIGATHIVIDIPTGRGTKTKGIGEAHVLASDFIDVGRSFGINVQCAVTFGEQPLGYAIGPALEAREALRAIMGRPPTDLETKAVSIAGMLLEMVGVRNGRKKAESILHSGKAEKKLREIIEAQGGDPNLSLEDIKVGDKTVEVPADRNGGVCWINNEDIALIAREAGAPKEKGAGVMLKAKLGEYVRKGDVLFEIYSERSTKLQAALDLAEKLQPMGARAKLEDRMLIDRIPTRIVHRRAFTMER